MPVKLVAAACLLVIGTLIGILSEFKNDEVEKEQDKSSPQKKLEIIKKNKRKRRALRYVAIALMFVSLILSFKILLDEHADQTIADNKRKKEYETTIAKLNITINKSDSLLDSLRAVRDITNHINGSLKSELSTLTKIDTTTKQLIEKNTEVMSTQTHIYQASDRIVNPLFPLEVQIEIEIPINDYRVKALKQYVLNANNHFNVFRFLQNKDLPKVIKLDDIVEGFDLYFLEDSVKKLSDITSVTRQLNFSIAQSELTNSELDTHFEDSTFYCTLLYNIPQLPFSHWESSTTTLGFSDLPHCFLGVRPYPFTRDYKLMYVKLLAKSGLQQSYEMWFVENKGIIDDCSQMRDDPEFGRVFVQKIISVQSARGPKTSMITRFHY